ncbi:MAG: hypothetical protein JXA04_06020 [Gammaproteobacteria bacterium]|nr:hypothetical protein [Gammaproteobacteria bacterium]
MDVKRFYKIIGLIFLVAFVAIVAVISAGLFQLQHHTEESPFVLDQVTVWEDKTINNQKYILARIISGFHDKSEEVVLFKGDIIYNKWNNPLDENIVFREFIDQRYDEKEHATRYSASGHLESEFDRIRVTFNNGEEQIFVTSIAVNTADANP